MGKPLRKIMQLPGCLIPVVFLARKSIMQITLCNWFAKDQQKEIWRVKTCFGKFDAFGINIKLESFIPLLNNLVR